MKEYQEEDNDPFDDLFKDLAFEDYDSDEEKED